MISAAFANRILTRLDPTIQMHTDDPGPNGTANVARGIGTRPLVLSQPVNGKVTNTKPVTWLGVAAMETYTHFTAWDADGTLLFTGTCVCPTVFAGDNLFIEPGELTAFFTVV